MWARERCARGGCEKTWSRRDGDVLLNPENDFRTREVTRATRVRARGVVET